ncbi:MAG TPA: EAL domain-containing protein [Noviherbaspirillum sp.]|uniref:EAL domain-containing protein n=1 Tax=Noviherbaspirillum sp. TaxID=1926288 RepID=UPI002B45FC14|nr:EAL domain-containing protein [Noviherbaspirillum sp.]HJV86323.1 EAL domain-containing protein [Noviherbaspirillum sp.]
MFRSRLPFNFSIATVLALAIGLICTAALFLGVRRLEHDKVELDFRQHANARILGVRQQLDETVQVLKVINQLFASFDPVSREQFRTYTQPLLDRYPFIQAFNFHRFVPAGERKAYEESMRAQFPGFAMTQLRDGKLVPAQERDRYLVVDYIEPFRGNEVAFGMDVSPNAQEMAAVQYAIDTGKAASTGLLHLAQGDGAMLGFVVVMPVYRHGIPLDDVEARRKAAIGDTAAVFDARGVMEKLLAANGMMDTADIDISVYAGSRLDEASLAYRRGAAPIAKNEASWIPGWIVRDRPESILRRFDVAGQTWLISTSAAPTLFADRHNGSLYGLIAGALISILFAAYVQALSLRSRRVHRLVEQRTAELRLANALLTDDIAARLRAEEGLRLRQRAIDASANAIIIVSATPPGYPIEYVNPAFERITGYSAADVVGRSAGMLWAQEPGQPEVEELRAAAREKREVHTVLQSHNKNGDTIWADVYLAPVRDEAGEVSHYVVALYDITATRRYQAELEFQANCDTLTGLANRSLLHDRLRQVIAYAERYGNPAWVLFINLDRFKFVNDTLGHHAGDIVLKCVAQRLRDAVRDTDTIARLSADEFVLVLPERADESLSPAVVQRIMDAITPPIVIEGYEFVMGCSVGIADCPADGTEPDVLIKHAGIAMYRAKEVGRNNFQFYTASMNERAMERLRIEGDLRNALEREEFVLHYQPQVDLATGRVVGVEALIRWQHPVMGMVPPVRFIELAEEMGMILPIGTWVMRTACRQSVEWAHAGLGQVRVAVNLSARQFYQQDLVATIAAILDETGIAPQLLELELTESMMMSDIEHAVGILRKLKALGVHLAIDDFGTGYSSLAYLKRFPIDVLKIDRSFVGDITVDPDDAAIVLSIISLAHSLRLQVVAEGVETEAQLAYLRRHGCDCMQGYYFSRPLPAQEFTQLLRHDRHLQPPAGNISGQRPSETLLIIDHEADSARALHGMLRQDGYQILNAFTSEEAIGLMARHEVQVVLCERGMPAVDGMALLGQVKSLYPQSICILLSHEAAHDTVIDAVKRGEIYRFFTRPWSEKALRDSIRDAFHHYWLLSGTDTRPAHVSA